MSNKPTNKELIEFAKEQCVIFPEDSDMGRDLRETIKILEDKATLLDKVKQAREEMDRLASHKVRPISFDQAVAIDMCINILDKLMKEVK